MLACACILCVCVCASPLTVGGLTAALLHDLKEHSGVVSLNRPRVELDCVFRQGDTVGGE